MKSCASDALLSVRLAIVENFPPADSPCWKRKFRGFDAPPGACCVFILLFLLMLFIKFERLLTRWFGGFGFRNDGNLPGLTDFR